jgi:Tat protein translocase TatB subunit
MPLFDISLTKLPVIAAVALVLIGSKDLPHALRTLGKWIAKMQRMAREFQHQFNEACGKPSSAASRRKSMTSPVLIRRWATRSPRQLNGRSAMTLDLLRLLQLKKLSRSLSHCPNDVRRCRHGTLSRSAGRRNNDANQQRL